MSLHILSLHNRYEYRGGEDVVFESEANLLRDRGCRVTQMVQDHRKADSALVKAGMAGDALWSFSWRRKVEKAIEDERPDLVHVHNFFPSISPSVFYACRKASVPVVMTLHNYRLICVGKTLFRQGHRCEDCLKSHSLLPALRHSCYRGSFAQTAVSVGAIGLHWRLGTWNQVDRYVALTEFARRKFIEGGLPGERISVKPNFVQADPGQGTGARNGALFVGRLSAEKGLRTLLKAWKSLPEIPLDIVGEGPLENEVREATASMENVRLVGPLAGGQLMDTMRRAGFLVFASEWYEPFGLVLVESLACGTPIVAPRLGGSTELVSDEKTGLLYEPGSEADLIRQARRIAASPSWASQLGDRGRRDYLRRFSADRNFEMLMKIYHSLPLRGNGDAARRFAL